MGSAWDQEASWSIPRRTYDFQLSTCCLFKRNPMNHFPYNYFIIWFSIFGDTTCLIFKLHQSKKQPMIPLVDPLLGTCLMFKTSPFSPSKLQVIFDGYLPHVQQWPTLRIVSWTSWPFVPTTCKGAPKFRIMQALSWPPPKRTKHPTASRFTCGHMQCWLTISINSGSWCSKFGARAITFGTPL